MENKIWPIPWKWLTLVRNGLKFGIRGYLYNIYGLSLSLLWSSHFGGIVSQWPVTWKRLQSKTEWYLELAGKCGMHMRYLWHFHVQGHFGVIWCTSCLNMGCNSNTTACWAKRVEIWESLLVLVCIHNTFEILVFMQGHFRVIRCTCLKWPVTRKWLV